MRPEYAIREFFLPGCSHVRARSVLRCTALLIAIVEGEREEFGERFVRPARRRQCAGAAGKIDREDHPIIKAMRGLTPLRAMSPVVANVSQPFEPTPTRPEARPPQCHAHAADKPAASSGSRERAPIAHLADGPFCRPAGHAASSLRSQSASTSAIALPMI
jgi:hypothetical protein